jgi:uncharacterized membrane protein YvbJ
MCGNKVEDTDHYCQHCGTPTGYREQSAPSVEEEKKKKRSFSILPMSPSLTLLRKILLLRERNRRIQRRR